MQYSVCETTVRKWKVPSGVYACRIGCSQMRRVHRNKGLHIFRTGNKLTSSFYFRHESAAPTTNTTWGRQAMVACRATAQTPLERKVDTAPRRTSSYQLLTSLRLWRRMLASLSKRFNYRRLHRFFKWRHGDRISLSCRRTPRWIPRYIRPALLASVQFPCPLLRCQFHTPNDNVQWMNSKCKRLFRRSAGKWLTLHYRGMWKKR